VSQTLAGGTAVLCDFTWGARELNAYAEDTPGFIVLIEWRSN